MKDYKVTAVVLAAGQGSRMHLPVAKQFYMLKGKPVIYYSLKAYEDSCVDEIILVTGAGQIDYCKENIVKQYHMEKVIQIIEGGKERYESVYQALINIEKTDYVLIHDGARPFITSHMIDNVVRQVMSYGACIIGVPVKETIKIVDSEGRIKGTPDRKTLWSAQTPQAFKYAEIRKAYDLFFADGGMMNTLMTDDAMVYETYIKHKIKLIPGDYTNLKLTTQEDILIAEALIENM